MVALTAPNEGVELPRAHDLDPRRWRLPSGEVVFETVNRDAIELLKADPDEFFRRTRRPSC
ncbi:hypothetical protein SEA_YOUREADOPTED_81 [Mycobacterium phage YoureAdopted]|nr:hypothetical protein SEA_YOUREADOPTED_81 [Mycobacterium phage YoureAdopted]UQT02003.1 hypothetical protein SEA_GANYMEDE_82 [Mycobacterium phage Ganymede]